jgi:flagellar basal body-associated protein FliL
MAEEQEEKKGGGIGKLVLILGALVVVGAGAGVSAWLFLSSGDPAAEGADGAPREVVTRPVQEIFFKMEPPLLANIGSPGRVRYAQVGPVFSFTDKAIEAQFDQASPVIRDNLLRVLNGYSYDRLTTPEGREDARVAMLESVRALLRERTGIENGVSSLYFDSFVVQ